MTLTWLDFVAALYRGDNSSVGSEGAVQARQVQTVEDCVVPDLQHGCSIHDADGEGDDGVVNARQLVDQVACVHGVFVHNHLHLYIGFRFFNKQNNNILY